MPCSVASQCLGSAGTPSGPVPVRSFSPLAPVHVVFPLQLAQFQAELRDYPDQAAASHVLTGLRDGFRIGFEASSASLRSVSANMLSTLVHLSYVTVDSFIEGIMARGQGTIMAKFDVASAYRNVAIHPQDRSLLGMGWRGMYYVDMALPFGLRSAPYIFTAIADVVEWILTHNYGVTFLRHYLDYFMTLGPPASPVCHYNLQACIRLCTILGLPLHPRKLEGLTTCLSILGIELDSTTLQARLPEEKRDGIVRYMVS